MTPRHGRWRHGRWQGGLDRNGRFDARETDPLVGADDFDADGDGAALRPDPCLAYRVVVAQDVPVDRTVFTTLRARPRTQARHGSAAGDARTLYYLVVPFSLSAGEGSWGERFDGRSRSPR